jgi:hypothetical protein
MRRTRLLAGTISVAVLLALPASAKEGVRAKLDGPVALDAAPGKTLRVAWHLIDDRGRPFGASGIYLRVSRCGHSPLRFPATARGSGGFSVRLKVPAGGIRKLMVGLEGFRSTGGQNQRADMFFRFDPPAYRDCP